MDLLELPEQIWAVAAVAAAAAADIFILHMLKKQELQSRIFSMLQAVTAEMPVMVLELELVEMAGLAETAVESGSSTSLLESV